MLSFLSFVRVLTLICIGGVLGQATLPPPGQPTYSGTAGKFAVVGDSLVSAQQIFLGTADKVYVIDKVENNPTQIQNHPAWAAEYSVSTNNARAMDVRTNTFCAGGNVMGNGTWVNVGGNQPITYGGLNWDDPSSNGPYNDPDGRRSIRLLNPCDDGTCNWSEAEQQMDSRRWYPTVETLEDGTVIILGGCTNGGFVNDAGQNIPTYEFFPSRGNPVHSSILDRSLPANLYPLTWLLPSGKLLIQSNWNTVLLDYHTNEETPLDDIPDAVRTYPASAGTAMMPLTPANNWTATIMFCGGTNLQPDEWLSTQVVSVPASKSCVKITPDVSPSYTHDDPLPVGRSMANFIHLPNGKLFCLNGVETGTAGYGNQSWAIGESYGDNPVLEPVIYDPEAPQGQRWSDDGLSPSTVNRLYHSSALLLPDGSVFVSGSNPNSDVNVGPGVKYFTEYRVERFFPSYYNERRPNPSGIPKNIGYGGSYFDITLDQDDLSGDANNLNKTSVVLIRPGFSTHAMNMGQRFVQLQSSYTGYSNGTGVLHVSQLPPNPAILVPGTALLFVVVNGVPSVGLEVMIGNGQLGLPEVQEVQELPSPQITNDNAENNNSGQDSAAVGLHLTSSIAWFYGFLVLFFLTW
ncbi:DUF1929-domain-containing protein [Dendrothele bispora CBS 962.96]|uniref:DUF1929-domain-containing protein n=1 Tax=Dendrothele bispora (strain CBS 962.96) TaxID=1314807 RepID=A0A4S8LWU8_DENBC|nr:DUF1929-domain-containing protein [Dendrothele bispora CBS 962.96]